MGIFVHHPILFGGSSGTRFPASAAHIKDMTDFKARQPEGIPTGGQFATATHAEPDLALGATARRPELEGWPESMPEPTLKLEVDDEGGITTNLIVDGHGTISVFTDNPSTGRCDYTRFEGDFEVDEETLEQVVEWTSEKHLAMEYELRSKMKAAAALVSGSIAARASGKPTPATDEELNRLVMNGGHVVAEARTTSELAAMALASREILRLHPDAATGIIDYSSDEDGDYISSVRVMDAEGMELAEYGENPGEDPENVVDLIRSLNPDAGNSAWSDYTLRADGFNVASFEEDGRTLNLAKAADWAPSA